MLSSICYMKKEIETLNYYDGISSGYETLYHHEQKQKILKVLTYIPIKGRILDLGSGDGVLNEYVDKNVDFFSCDLSFELLKLNSNSIKIQANAQKLPFKYKVFDSVVSFTMLQDVPDPVGVILNVRNILKEEGIFVLSVLKMSSKIGEILQEVENFFKIVEKIEEEKDFIFILKKN